MDRTTVRMSRVILERSGSNIYDLDRRRDVRYVRQLLLIDRSTTVIVACVVLAAACGTPETPHVSTRSAALTTDDLAVMKAVLDGFVRQGRSSPANTSVVVFGSTLRACPTSAPTSTTLALPDCVDEGWLQYLNPLVGSPSGPGVEAWRRRNVNSVAISGGLGDRVIYAPATLDRGDRLLAFARQHDAAAIVELSAPAYGSGSAVVAYRDFHHGLSFVRLQGSSDRWKVVSVRGATE